MKLLVFLSFLLVFPSCGHRPSPPKKIEQTLLSVMFDSYWEERARVFPLDATQQGDNRYNHLLPNDQTKEFRERLSGFFQGHLNQLKAFNRDTLDENDKISYDIFKYEMEIQLEGLKDNQWMIPFHQFWGLPLLIGQLGSGESFQPFKTVEDYYNWLGRLEGFATWSRSAIDNFRAGMRVGYVLPRPLVLKMIPQMEAMVVSDPEKSLFYDPIKKFPKEFSEEDKQKLVRAYKHSISEHVVPTFKRLGLFLKQEYLPKARKSHGISSLKGGAKSYSYLARYWTTTTKSPEEIYQMGLSEVKRIRSEMEGVKAQVNYKGSLQDFFKHIRNDPKLMPYKTPEEVLDAFRAIHTTMQPQLSKIFGRTPKTPFEIKRTEAFREATASAEYSPGSPDGNRPGVFYLPVPDATKFNVTSGMESLFLHEAIPGHHYQISLQQENEDLPKFRRFSWYGAYGEGWALYTESLGKELGLYKDPYQYMGALGDEMHRALRLVVDVAIHLKGMTREAAIKYLMDNEPIALEGAVAEIERYMAIPGQALSYKIGSLKIWELRKKYNQRKGFNLSNFHDDFLKDGCMPLEVVERKMDAWSSKL